jgi:hypothetical protein
MLKINELPLNKNDRAKRYYKSAIQNPKSKIDPTGKIPSADRTGCRSGR